VAAEIMPEQNAGDRRRNESRDLLTAEEFFDTLRHVVAFREQPHIADPLQHALAQITANPAFAQSRLLMRILIGLVSGGEFRRAEAAMLDASTQALVIALIDLHRAGTRSPQDWSRAVDAAEAAAGG
jgi:hypothetical protein